MILRAVALLTLLALAKPAVAQEQTVLILNGRVMDGSGNPWVRADVLIQGDKIIEIGDLSDVSADDMVDATGLYVTPGFIDTHSHSGPGLATVGLSHAEPLLAMGLTTIFANPDGGGPIDLSAQRIALERDGLGVNVAQLIGHGSARSQVIGQQNRVATPAELDRMRAIVREAMDEGAWGLSSGTFYVPGNYAPPEEIEELASSIPCLASAGYPLSLPRWQVGPHRPDVIDSIHADRDRLVAHRCVSLAPTGTRI